jgi:cyanophycin synthetase
MLLTDARRLTGANLLARVPLAAVELAFEPGDDPAAGVEAYRAELVRLRAALDWPATGELLVRHHPGGALCGFAEPIDVLLAATELAEWAGQSATELLAGRPGLPLEPKRTEVAAMLAAQRRPRLLALQAETVRRGLPFLWDDEEVSVGAGAQSRRWPIASAPPPDDVPWGELGTVPVAVITGTNGKTTCSRLLSRVAREAGLIAGSTSTDGIAIDGRTLEEGDMTGPAAARSVLRHPSVQLAVLETARGGIMRRGLAVDFADAALITNVSADHLGEYGIDDVQGMARVKAVVGSVVRPQGRVVLNALDPELVALADSFPAPVIYFSLDADAPALLAHRARGGEAWLARDGWLVRARGNEETPVLKVAEVPVTFGGAASYNVENALAVAALSSALGLPEAALVAALRGFSAAENPRRGHLVEVDGVRVLLDFGHNPEGVRAVLGLVSALRAGTGGRLAVITGLAGDRRDAELVAVAGAIAQAGPDLVLLRELDHYLRGRQPGEVPERFRQEFARLGLPESAVQVAQGEADALRQALDWAQPGDFIALLVYLEEEGVRELLAARS